MKLILLSLLLFGMAAPLMAAESTETKKETAKSEGAKKKAKGPPIDLQPLVDSLSAAQKTKLMSLVNEGDDKALATLPGIGPVRATAIKASRPFAAPLDILKVPGIGDTTLQAILNHAKADFPPAPPKTKGPGKKKEAAKKGESEEKK